MSSQSLDGHLQIVDIHFQDNTYCVINVYAPCDSRERKLLLNTISQLVIPDSTFILGDFNTIQSHED